MDWFKIFILVLCFVLPIVIARQMKSPSFVKLTHGRKGVEMPAGLTNYKSTAVFTRETVPAALLNDHSTKVWALIRVKKGFF